MFKINVRILQKMLPMHNVKSVSINPILEYIACEVKEDELILQTTDLVNSIVSRTNNIKVEEPIKFLIKYKQFKDLLSKLNDGEIVIKTKNSEKENSLVIKKKRRIYKFPTMRFDNFPHIEAKNYIDYDFSKMPVLSKQVLKTIQTASNFASKADDKIMLQGVFVGNRDEKDDTMDVVATDIHYMYFSQIKAIDIENVIIPTEAVKSISLPGEESRFSVVENQAKRKIVLLQSKTSDFEFIATIRAINEKFANYKALFGSGSSRFDDPESDYYSIKLNKNSILQALGRLKVFADDAESSIVFQVEDNNLILSNFQEVSNAKAVEVVEFEGDIPEGSKGYYNLHTFKKVIPQLNNNFFMYYRDKRSALFFKDEKVKMVVTPLEL